MREVWKRWNICGNKIKRFYDIICNEYCIKCEAKTAVFIYCILTNIIWKQVSQIAWCNLLFSLTDEAGGRHAGVLYDNDIVSCWFGVPTDRPPVLGWDVWCRTWLCRDYLVDYLWGRGIVCQCYYKWRGGNYWNSCDKTTWSVKKTQVSKALLRCSFIIRGD